jgi:hypothetical protein
LLFLGIKVADAAEMPESVVEVFYERFIHPSKTDYGKPYFESVTDLVSSGLLASLKAQHEYERKCVLLGSPEEKPHMLDQNPFFFAPDGIKALLGAKSTLSDGTSKVDVVLGYDDLTWHDIVVLRREKGRWLVDNIFWGSGGSLSARLSSFMEVPCGT